MYSGKSTDQSESVEYQNETPIKKIEHVHFGIFFDGTNNNMVQQAYFQTFKKDGQQVNLMLDKRNIEDAKAGIEKQNMAYRDAISRIERRKELQGEYDLLLSAMTSADGRGSDYPNVERMAKLYGEMEALDDEIEKIQATQSHIDIGALYSDKENGYSNIAILHSLLKEQSNTDKELYYNIYVEGSGANDIARSLGETGFFDKGNINGLGFGLGLTGVTALVSKAIKYVYNYLTSVDNIDENTKYHFYVFGFSRGATCARLFAELATRDEGKTLDREKEFGQNTSRVKQLFDKKSGRLPFMEKDFLNAKPLIKRANVTVDFLGIYDTVASIGFLKQKDGWTNSLSWSYRGFWWNNYHGNFHYMNAHDYGLYSPHNERVLHTCHICAADEFRENFALVNLGSQMPKNAMEIIMPGCHSDVGGGYVTETSIDYVLYKFVPRKMEHFIKHNKLTELMGYNYLKSKKRASMFINSPISRPLNDSNVSELNPDTLARLGWIGREWLKNSKVFDISKLDKKPFTLRVANWTNEIKFKRFSYGGYGSIPLKMMKKCFEKCGCIDLFIDTTTPYEIPTDLKEFGNNMLDLIGVPCGQRIWAVPNGGYSGEFYRKLRLKYLHFTSSCEIAHFRTKVNKEKMHKAKDSDKDKESWYKYGELNGANFGNNCNYDNDAHICRIVYFGDENIEGDHQSNVHYMYELSDKMDEFDVGYGDSDLKIIVMDNGKRAL